MAFKLVGCKEYFLDTMAASRERGYYLTYNNAGAQTDWNKRCSSLTLITNPNGLIYAGQDLTSYLCYQLSMLVL